MTASNDVPPHAACAIAVMAKTPQPGRSKTRLAPPLSLEQAAAMSAAFLHDTTANLALAAQDSAITPYVAYAPAGLEALLRQHIVPTTRLILADGTPDMPPNIQGFGRCLLHAIQALLDAGHPAACVLNSDGPTLPTAILRHTADLLAQPGDRAVLGPAEDGGYYLLGLKQPHHELFSDIAWSTSDVADQTRARARAAGLDLIELPVWYDVDDRASLARLLTALDTPSPEPFPAPATRAAVERFQLRELLGCV